MATVYVTMMVPTVQEVEISDIDAQMLDVGDDKAEQIANKIRREAVNEYNQTHFEIADRVVDIWGGEYGDKLMWDFDW